MSKPPKTPPQTTPYHGLPDHVAGSGTLDRLVDTARDYAEAATAENTNKAYVADWTHFARWCRTKGADPLPPSPELIALYLVDLATPENDTPARSVATDRAGVSCWPG